MLLAARASASLRNKSGASALEVAQTMIKEAELGKLLKQQDREYRQVAEGKAEAARILRAH
eukprot:7062515-Prymnesium_polylepis.1